MPPYANENYFRCGSKFTDYTTYGYEINQDGEIAFEKWQEDVQNFIKFFNNGFAPSNDSIPKEITIIKESPTRTKLTRHILRRTPSTISGISMSGLDLDEESAVIIKGLSQSHLSRTYSSTLPGVSSRSSSSSSVSQLSRSSSMKLKMTKGLKRQKIKFLNFKKTRYIHNVHSVRLQ